MVVLYYFLYSLNYFRSVAKKKSTKILLWNAMEWMGSYKYFVFKIKSLEPKIKVNKFKIKNESRNSAYTTCDFVNWS